MDIPAIQPHVKASELPFDELAANKSIPQREKVAEACRQFEAVLLRQILQSARKPLLDSSAAGQQTTSGVYDDMINNQLADSMSRSGGFGLAKSLQSQLIQQILPADHAAQAGPASPTTKTSSPQPSHDRKHP
jgi:flagellar protein FlgJ